MNDYFPFPTVITRVKIGNFTLRIRAYRKVTNAEIGLSIRKYLRENHLRQLPVSGSAELITTFGIDPTDSI